VSEYQGDVHIWSEEELYDGINRNQLTKIHDCKGSVHHHVSISGLSLRMPGDNRFEIQKCMKIGELSRESCVIEEKRHSNTISGA
jgi:hypothetical protein